MMKFIQMKDAAVAFISKHKKAVTITIVVPSLILLVLSYATAERKTLSYKASSNPLNDGERGWHALKYGGKAPQIKGTGYEKIIIRDDKKSCSHLIFTWVQRLRRYL